MSDEITPDPDDSPLPTSIVKGMKRTREAYETDISDQVVQQTVDRIVAQTVDAVVPGNISEHPRRRVRPLNRPLWFGMGLAAGVVAALLLTQLPFMSGFFTHSRMAPGGLQLYGVSRTQTVSVADPARAVRTCIAELIESGVPFSYRVTGDGMTLDFAGAEQLSDAMIKWLNDHGVEPPRAGEQIRLVFVRTG
jgi:hypothetical protein